MIKKLSSIILLLSLVACKPKLAFNYSEDFVKKERSLEPEIIKTETRVAKFIEGKQYDSIGIIAARMEDLIDIKLKEVEDTPAPDVKEGSNFKRAGIEYFEFMRSVYTAYKNYGNAKTPEEREEQLNKLKEIVIKKDGVISDVKAAQQKFADANGFKINK